MPPPTNTPFPTAVRQIKNGDPVAAEFANPPINDVAMRTQNLRERIENLEVGQTLWLPGVVLTASLLPGTPVFMKPDGTADAAAALSTGDVIGDAAAADAYVAGLLLPQTDPVQRILALSGIVASLTLAQWAQVIDDGVAAPGHYFLSETRGKLTRRPGALSVHLGQLLPDGRFVLGIEAPRRGEHVHYEFAMTAAPAGDVVDPATGQPHVISNPNPSLRGWLPASAPYFDPATIPVGAKFGYNLAHASDAELAQVFPPVPLSGATFIQAGQVLQDSLVTVNQYGIWWMQDAYGMAPWPVDFAATQTVDDLTLWFSHLMFATSGGIVASLGSHPQSVLAAEFVNKAGEPAMDGALLLLVRELLVAGAADRATGVAVKQIAGRQVHTGPVVDTLVAGPGVQLQGTAGDAKGWAGAVTVSIINSDALQGDADVVNLQNATEDTVSDTQVVMLRAARVSQPVFSLNVSRRAPATNALRVVVWLFSSKAGAVPVSSLSLEYRVIPPPGATAVPLPTGWTGLHNFAGVNVTANGYVEITTAPIAGVPAGSQVLIRATRLGVTDGFTGNLGFVRMGFTLE